MLKKINSDMQDKISHEHIFISQLKAFIHIYMYSLRLLVAGILISLSST